MVMVDSIVPPRLEFSSSAERCFAIWLRLRSAHAQPDREAAASELVDLGAAPDDAAEAAWLCHLMLAASGLVAAEDQRMAVRLAQVAAHVAVPAPLTEMTARGVLGGLLAKADLNQEAALEYRRAVTLSYEHGPVEARLMDLARICSCFRARAQHAETIESARELLREAVAAKRDLSTVVAYEFLGDSLAALGEWDDVLVFAELERVVLTRNPGRGAAVALRELEARVARARAALERSAP